MKILFYCYFKPIKFTGNKDNDIVAVATIHYKKGTENEKIALEYLKYLIKANNSELTDDEIKTLIGDAKRLSPDKKKANIGKFIEKSIFMICSFFDIINLKENSVLGGLYD